VHLRLVEGNSDPLATTRDFLMSLHAVVEAEVWERKGTILARVCIGDDSLASEVDLRQACLREVGSDATPQMIMVERIRRPGVRAVA